MIWYTHQETYQYLREIIVKYKQLLNILKSFHKALLTSCSKLALNLFLCTSIVWAEHRGLELKKRHVLQFTSCKRQSLDLYDTVKCARLSLQILIGCLYSSQYAGWYWAGHLLTKGFPQQQRPIPSGMPRLGLGSLCSFRKGFRFLYLLIYSIATPQPNQASKVLHTKNKLIDMI